MSRNLVVTSSCLGQSKLNVFTSSYPLILRLPFGTTVVPFVLFHGSLSIKSSRTARIKIRSLFCGTPKYFEFNTSKSTRYPISLIVLTIVSNVFRLSCPTSPLTFSRNKYCGRRLSATRTISTHKVPLLSSNPPPRPAIEELWQGNPPQIQSTCPLSPSCRISSSVTLVMSCAVHSPSILCIASYDFLAYLSNSTY